MRDFETGRAKLGGRPTTVECGFDRGEFLRACCAFDGVRFGDLRCGRGAFVLRGNDRVDETEAGIEGGLRGGADGGRVER